MADNSDQFVSLNGKKLEVLEKCLQVMSEKTSILVECDLTALEQSVEREGHLLEELVEIDAAIAKIRGEEGQISPDRMRLGVGVCHGKLDSRSLEQVSTIRNRLEETASEIQLTRRKNFALIQRGQQYTSAMLEVFHPLLTYLPTGGGPQVHSTRIVSLEC